MQADGFTYEHKRYPPGIFITVYFWHDQLDDRLDDRNTHVAMHVAIYQSRLY